MAAVTTTPSTSQRSQGRVYFWAGLFACLLGPALVAAQVALKRLDLPFWYSPGLATLGAFLLLVAVACRGSIPRVIALVLIAAFAGLQWYFLVSLARLPEYNGPARAGQPFPVFRSSLADGRSFTGEDLRDGSRRVLVFFRGRW